MPSARNAREPERENDEGLPGRDPLRTEAENRAHDRLTPDQMLDAFAAIDLYVEAFVAGARYANEQRRSGR